MKFNNLELKIYTDFDGTITKLDIGDEIFRVFGQFEPFHTHLIEHQLQIRDYWKSVWATIKKEFAIADIFQWLQTVEIDSNFKKFVDFCNQNKLPISILSDGFDLYIDYILKTNKISNVKVYCNKIEFEDSLNFKITYPYATESCDCLVASCKRNTMINSADENDVLVYIGDGYSDFCVAEHADIIFAKKALAAYCTKNRIPHYTYKNFFDVQRILEKILTSRSFKHRHQAKLKRKKAFEIE